MKSILNIGVNDTTIQKIIEITQNPGFGYHLQIRFLESFGTHVYGVPCNQYQEIIEAIKQEEGIKNKSQLSPSALKRIIRRYKTVIKIPSDPYIQLILAIKTMFHSWHSVR